MDILISSTSCLVTMVRNLPGMLVQEEFYVLSS